LTRQEWELLPFWFPKSKRDQIWAVIFALVIWLSIDWWAWDSNARIGNWLPVWIYHLIIVQFILAYGVWEFSKEWQKDE